jgi:nucleoside-diphosphate-sugar epimerase
MNLYKPTKILITGVNGFVGSHLAERLIENKIEVIGLSRNIEKISWLENKGLKSLKGDILNISEFENNITGCDVIVHSASWSGNLNISEDMAWKTNVEGTANIISLAKKLGIKKIIYISSIAVYGLNNSLLIDESTNTPFINELYTDSKITAENLIINSGMPYVIIRPGCIYGPRGEGWSIGIINKLKVGLN